MEEFRWRVFLGRRNEKKAIDLSWLCSHPSVQPGGKGNGLEALRDEIFWPESDQILLN